MANGNGTTNGKNGMLKTIVIAGLLGIIGTLLAVTFTVWANVQETAIETTREAISVSQDNCAEIAVLKIEIAVSDERYNQIISKLDELILNHKATEEFMLELERAFLKSRCKIK